MPGDSERRRSATIHGDDSGDRNELGREPVRAAPREGEPSQESTMTLRETFADAEPIHGGPVLTEVLGQTPELVPAAPTLRTDETHPDAALLDLWRRREAAHDIERRALERLNALQAAAQYPAPPASLFLRAGDDTLKLASYAVERTDGRLWYPFEAADAERRGWRRAHWRWRDRPVRPEDKPPSYAHTVAEKLPWPEAQARADEIAAAWDAHRAAVAEIRAAFYLDAANEAWEAADDELAALDGAIARTPARTMRGLAIKAQLARWDMDEGNDPNDVLVAGLVADILALEGGA